MATITSDMKVGEIVRNWPQTMRVFRNHGLNLQCGGTHSVAFAAGKHGFEPGHVPSRAKRGRECGGVS